jgi:hypothetical protein
MAVRMERSTLQETAAFSERVLKAETDVEKAETDVEASGLSESE